jgi:TRAP-type C4-dicarboxylate transport system permease small subunit
MMAKFDRILAKLEETAIFVCIVFTTFAICFNVVMRNIFHYPLSWPDEMGRYLLILIIFNGYIIAVRRGSEIKLDMIQRLFPGSKRLFLLVSNGASILFSIVLVILGFKYMLLKYTLESKSVILEFPIWILVLILLVMCGSLLAYRYFVRMLKEYKKQQ